jgi:hypothetical protein
MLSFARQAAQPHREGRTQGSELADRGIGESMTRAVWTMIVTVDNNNAMIFRKDESHETRNGEGR